MTCNEALVQGLVLLVSLALVSSYLLFKHTSALTYIKHVSFQHGLLVKDTDSNSATAY